MADRLGFGHGRAHGLGALFELSAYAFAIDGLRVAIPGKALNADLSDIAAKTAIALQKRRLNACAGTGQGGRKSPRPRSNHQDVRLMDDVDRTRWLKEGSNGHQGVLGHQTAGVRLLRTFDSAKPQSNHQRYQ